MILSVLFVFKDRVSTIYVGLTKNWHTRHFLRKYVDKHDFLYLHNLCLRISPGQYIHVDHVIVGDRFIYVIATKFYYGFLNGKDIDEKWVLSDGKETQIIDNPLLANELKVGYISRILNVNPNVLVNIVLVSRTTVIDSVEIHNPSLHLLEEDNVLRFIDKFENDKNYPVFNIGDLEKTASDLYEYHKASVEDRRMNNTKWNH